MIDKEMMWKGKENEMEVSFSSRVVRRIEREWITREKEGKIENKRTCENFCCSQRALTAA